MGATGPAENRVLVKDPEVQSKIDETKQKRDNITSLKAKLLGSLTEQMKAIMLKLREEGISEDKQESLRALLMQVKSKMDKINGPEKPPPAPVPAPVVTDDVAASSL